MTAAKPLLDPDFLARLQRLEIVSKKIFVGKTKGERLSKRKGQSVEFADFRSYVVGDEFLFLDWNLLRALDRLFLRLFLEEEDLHVYVLVDNSQSMEFGNPTKLHYGKQVAAAPRVYWPLEHGPRRCGGIQRSDRAIDQRLARSAKPLAADEFSRWH